MLKVIAPLVYLLLYVLSVPVLAKTDDAPESSGDNKPNVLLLIADDLGYNDSAVYQDIYNQQAVTTMPALESLAKQGVRYTRFYTESTCSASRVALLTGQYPARNGFMPVARGISPDVITLPEFFKAQGYATHLVGKWHMGEINQEAFPLNQGFDTNFGFLNQWMLKGPDPAGNIQLKSPTYFNPWLLNQKIGDKQTIYKKYEGHLEDILTAHTVELIKSKKNNKQPWFIYHAFFAPHTPLEPAQRFADHFDKTPEGKYKAMLAQLDDSVLQILSALKESSQWDNTIIIFASDNGSAEKHNASNAPFTGSKAEYEEGGIRTPLLIKWQKKLQSTTPETRTDVVSIMDIYPSLVSAIAGAHVEKNTNLKNFDGIPSLIEKNPAQRHTFLYWLTYGELSILDADGNGRLVKQWDAESFTHTELFQYDKNTLPSPASNTFLAKIFNTDKKQKDQLFNSFLNWRNKVRSVPLIFTAIGNRGAGKITGRDFLRTPINPSYAIAFSFTANAVDKKQALLYQQGIVDVNLQGGNLIANINGLVLRQKDIQPGKCYSVVLSGAFYDRFTNLHEGILPSQLHLIVNGKETGFVTGEIASFEKLNISAPTFVGLRDDKDSFSGTIAQPSIFLTQLLPADEPIPSDIDAVTKGMCP